MSVTRVSQPVAPAPIPADYRADSQNAHVAQFYSDEAFLFESLSQFVCETLNVGGAVVLVVTEEHRDGIARALVAHGHDVQAAKREGRYFALDAAEILAKLMVSGSPSEQRFFAVIPEILDQARKGSRGRPPRVAAVGEMVSLLWNEGRSDAVIELERLSQVLGETQSFALRCAYPIRNFDRELHGEALRRICEHHSSVIPAESYSNLETEEARLRNIVGMQQESHALRTEAALRESEQRFRRLVESVQDYAIFMLDVDGHVCSWNLGAQRLKGYKPHEIIGRHFSTFYPEDDLRSGKPEMELRVAGETGRFEDEGWRVRKDGSRFWANVVITALRDQSGRLRGFAKVTRDFTERMRAAEKLAKTNDELRKEITERIGIERKLHESEHSLRKLSTHMVRMQDEEQRRLGRELHDSIGQYLAALKMGLDSIQSDIKSSDPETEKRLGEYVHLVDETIKEVRTISYLLYPPMLEEMGLRSAVSWYLDGFTKRSGIETTFDVASDIPRLGRDVELAIFRILQESLTNVHRHSESATARIRIWLADGNAYLEVGDSGKGIPRDVLEMNGEGSGTQGVGLRGMSERMRHLGGRLELHSSASGTTVRAVLPCSAAKLNPTAKGHTPIADNGPSQLRSI